MSRSCVGAVATKGMGMWGWMTILYPREFGQLCLATREPESWRRGEEGVSPLGLGWVAAATYMNGCLQGYCALFLQTVVPQIHCFVGNI
jgi:hypothetical protein